MPIDTPGSPEFIALYPFQVQQFKAYRNWAEYNCENHKTLDEAAASLRQHKARHGVRHLRVVDMRTGDVCAK